MSDSDQERPADASTDESERPLQVPPELAVLPLRDTVLFPNSFMPLAVAREASVRLVEEANTARRRPAADRAGPRPRHARYGRPDAAVSARVGQRDRRSAARRGPPRDRRAAAQHQEQFPPGRL